MFYIVWELQRIIHISANKCPIEMDLNPNLTLLAPKALSKIHTFKNVQTSSLFDHWRSNSFGVFFYRISALFD